MRLMVVRLYMEVGEGGRASLAGTGAREGRIATKYERVDEQLIKHAGVVLTTDNTKFVWDKGQQGVESHRK